jgi:hypothetical protein
VTGLARPPYGSAETWRTDEADLPGGVTVGGVALCVECRLYKPAETVTDVDGRALCPPCRGKDPTPGTDDAADAARAKPQPATRKARKK